MENGRKSLVLYRPGTKYGRVTKRYSRYNHRGHPLTSRSFTEKSTLDSISKLNINVPDEESPQPTIPPDYLLPPWKDITAFLDDATNDFDVGQLVHLKSFSLFDAMCAIEIMDPRMDTGMIVPGLQPISFDFKQHLKGQQVMWVMDRLLSYEMAWLSGHALSQTIYTCIYYHHIRELRDIPMPSKTSSLEEILYGALKTYILVTVKCCWYVWTEMTSQNIFEEEDFTTNLFGLSLFEEHEDGLLMNDLDTAIDLLDHVKQECNPEIVQQLDALIDRINIRKHYLLTLIYASHPNGVYFAQARTALANLESIMHKNGPGSITATVGTGEEVKGVFDPNINRKLISQAPPRPITLESDTKSLEYFRLLLNRLETICNVQDFPSVTSLTNFFLSFGATQPYADAFSRSKLSTIFYQDLRIFGQLPAMMVLRAVTEFAQRQRLWDTVSTSNQSKLEEANKALDRFLDKASLSFIDFHKIQCHNRSRQRRILRKVLGEWEMLQDEGAIVDELYYTLTGAPQVSYYLCSWTYHQKLFIMETILFLGFELELYGVHEYVMVYWYLLRILDSHTPYPMISEDGTQQLEPALLPCPNAVQYMTQAKRELSAGVMKICLVLEKKNRLLSRPLRFDDERTRYDHRFKMFAPLCMPPHPSYDSYRHSINIKNLTVENLLNAARLHFDAAKRTLNILKNVPASETNMEMCEDYYQKQITDMLRVCVANTLAVRFLENDNPVEIRFKYHTWWPVFERQMK
ncbi:Mak10 subunit, NatC N-terminal acetyltransferase-domain-containing protein [Radiomyces spectabilis]|uniref:Mak10 subunit, NatC N-terminal acetyltransferase-domain-containing protein n=1 Tax=Radiomyces spectabilis TaxID=64574 RepID=UPI002220C839|nr:Mak10 subunit, NatC N-terminal acetyltransferase-domain-containing protein [Radiomyces spectabilis]KAI8379557.1 Mak10 subunit, NatC N-terminal acetyltransferase-domain-containing protein [Radiomyces spectabilis]